MDTENLTIGVADLGTQTWDPADSNQATAAVRAAIGETLLMNDTKTRALIPGLAESWTSSPDGLEWTFKLRPNVPFHDGWGNVTAEDVKFTFEQYFGPTSDQGNVYQAFSDCLDGDPAKNIEIVNELEIKLHCKQFVLLLEDSFANGSSANSLRIQSKKYWDEKPDEALLHPIGTGPFKFVSSTPGTEVKLQAVEDHWRQTPTFKNVTLKIVPDDAARLTQVQAGELDLAIIPGALVNEAKTAGVDVLSATNYGNLTMVWGGINPGQPEGVDTSAYNEALLNVNDNTGGSCGADGTKAGSPWNDATAGPEKAQLVREAMAMAVDNQAVVDAVLGGEGELTNVPIVGYSSIESRVDPSWPQPTYDPEGAKQKLAEAGYPNGFPLTMLLFESRSGIGQTLVGEAVAGFYEAIGLQVNRVQITDQQSDEYWDLPTGPRLGGCVFVRFDPFYDKQQRNWRSNYDPTRDGGHKVLFDPGITKELLGSLNEPDAAKRDALYKENMTSLIDRTVMGPLFSINWPVAAGPRVGSWDLMTGDGVLNNLESITP